MIDPDQHEEKPAVETVQTATDKEHLEAQADVVSDPALADQIGTDWTDEGGATPDGPATTSHQTQQVPDVVTTQLVGRHDQLHAKARRGTLER